jgi:hypothetical protein
MACPVALLAHLFLIVWPWTSPVSPLAVRRDSLVCLSAHDAIAEIAAAASSATQTMPIAT